MDHHVNSIPYIDHYVKFTKENIQLLGSASNVHTAKEVENFENDYSRTTTDTPKKMMYIYADSMRHMVSLCKNVTLLAYKTFLVKVVIRMSGLIHTTPMQTMLIERNIRSANEVGEEAAEKLFEI